MYKIVALFGKAGAGKDTILNGFCNKYRDDYNKIISCTTRPSRDYEKDGIDYHFLTNAKFLEEISNGNMLEVTEFRDWFYGTSKSNLTENKINIGVFNPEGVLNLMETASLEKNIIIIPIEIYAKDVTRIKRQLDREQNPDCLEICRRFQTDEADFEKFYYEVDFYCNRICNPNSCDLNNIYNSISRIIKSI
jgi:guanylate kinase